LGKTTITGKLTKLGLNTLPLAQSKSDKLVLFERSKQRHNPARAQQRRRPRTTNQRCLRIQKSSDQLDFDGTYHEGILDGTPKIKLSSIPNQRAAICLPGFFDTFVAPNPPAAMPLFNHLAMKKIHQDAPNSTTLEMPVAP